MQSCNDVQRLLRSILEQQPTRRFGTEEQRGGDDYGEDELESKRKAPLQSASFEVEAVVHPIREAKSGRVADGTDDDELASHAGVRAFGLVYRTGRRSQTHADTIDDAANQHLREMEGHNLKDSSDGVASEAEGDGPSAAKLVADHKSQHGAEEGSELDT